MHHQGCLTTQLNINYGCCVNQWIIECVTEILLKVIKR